MNIRIPILKLFLLVWACTAAGAFSQAASAQGAAPQIANFYVESDNQLDPGAVLSFTLQGTPQGKASVRIGATKKVVQLKEVEQGVYKGSYTIARSDKMVPGSPLRASLRLRNLSTAATFAASPGSLAAGAPPAVAGMPRIERFSVAPIAKIEPGADLVFAMTGTPGATASVNIEGVANNIPMKEVSRGNFEGAYTIRRMDNLPASVAIVGTLQANGQTARSRLNQSLLADAKPPVISNAAPRDGETIAGGMTQISATFDDTGGVGVDPKTARILIGGRDMTQNASITPQFFTLRANLRPGTYPVEVQVKDLAGNTVRRRWTFTVGPQTGTPQAAAATTLPLQITSHANNASVGGATEVKGRTAPDAKVDVQVNAIASLAGLFGITQQIFNQSVQADANGNFSFTFNPPMSVPGTRYEIAINATKADLQKDMKLVLVQQK